MKRYWDFFCVGMIGLWIGATLVHHAQGNLTMGDAIAVSVIIFGLVVAMKINPERIA